MEGLDFHGVSHQLLGCLQFDDCMVSGHIAEDRDVVWLVVEVADHIVPHLLIVDYLSVKLGLVSWHCAIEIHEILGQSASLVKTCEIDHATSNHLILLDTEDAFLLQLLNRIDDPKGHAYRQTRRHCNQDQVDELIDDI